MSVSIQGNLGKTKISNLKDRRELVTQYKQTSPKYSAKLHTCNALMKNTYIRKDKLYIYTFASNLKSSNMFAALISRWMILGLPANYI